MTVPSWINDTIRAFGRQAGMQNFQLSESGTAGARFENGLTLRFEYARERLVISMGLAAEAQNADLIKRFLTEAHPDGGGRDGVRAAYSTLHGEAILAIALKERDVRSDTLEQAFRTLFARMERLGRAR